VGILGDIGKVIIGGALGGPAGAVSVFTAQHGSEVVEGSIDFARMIVKVGTDIYRATPPEVFVAAGDPLQGLLKHEAEDELIMLGQIAGDAAIYSGITWPAVGPFGAAAHLYVAGRLLLGKVHFRSPNSQEWEMARHIFGNSLPGRPVAINLAGAYEPNATTSAAPKLFHEMTHVWQAERRLLKEVFLYDALSAGSGHDENYRFNPGRQWNEYNIEQQASIVEAWTRGATRKGEFGFNDGATGKLSINSPQFRYINGNIRRANDEARTRRGDSVRQLLSDGSHQTLKAMHPRPPSIWWN
jgi:hypothetical protein